MHPHIRQHMFKYKFIFIPISHIFVPVGSSMMISNVLQIYTLCPSSIQEVYKDTSTQVHSLRQMLKEKDEAIQRQSNLEKKIHELEKQGTIKIHKKGDGDISILPTPSSGVEGSSGVMMGGNGVAVGPNHVGIVAGAPAPPPPPPPPLPVNGTCRFNISPDIFAVVILN